MHSNHSGDGLFKKSMTYAYLCILSDFIEKLPVIFQFPCDDVTLKTSLLKTEEKTKLVSGISRKHRRTNGRSCIFMVVVSIVWLIRIMLAS